MQINLYIFICTSLSKAKLEILRNSSTILESRHQKSSIKKLFLKILRYQRVITCVGSLFNKVVGFLDLELY